MKVKVTEEDIREGKIGSCSKCPIALAIGRAVKDAVVVRARKAYTHDKRFVLPTIARQFIKRFDAGAKVQPFSFVLADSAFSR